MKFLAAVAIVLVGMIPSLSVVHADGQPTLRQGDKGDAVVVVQQRLIDFGYTLTTDGRYGPRTDRAVRHFQRSNGLRPDGIVGKLTWKALEGSVPATTQVPSRAPAFSDNCDEMSWYRQQAGLPEQFDAIGYRESRCRNDVTSRTGCCHGWLQLYLASSMRAPGYRGGVAGCGVNSVDDIRGHSDAQKRAQMCVAKVMYDVSGMGPWSL